MKQSIKQISILSAVPVLAIALVAVVSAAQANALTTTTTVSSAIGSIISVFTSSGTVNLNSTPSASGVQTIASDTITVSTNNTAGYTLSLAESTASSALVSGGNSIPATSGTYAAPVAQTANTWGYRLDGVGSFGAGPTSAVSNQAIGTAKFAAVPTTASPQTIKTTAATATNDTTTVWYGVAVNTATPTGTYTNSVTYTAVTN